MRIKNLYLILSATAISSCASVTFPNARICSVAGRLQAGMDCAFTGSDKTQEMNMREAIDFLEAGALCMSSQDYLKQKNAIEKLCYDAGSKCSYETQKQIEKLNARIGSVLR